MAQLPVPSSDTKEQCNCSFATAYEALAVCVTSLNTAQIAINTAQAALQRVTPIPTHALLTALGARIATPAEVSALASVAAQDQVPATNAPRVHVSVPSTPDGYPDTLSDTSSGWNVTASRPPSPDVAIRESTAASQRWYAITVGRSPGVYQGSDHVNTNCTGISGNLAINYPTQAEAEAAYKAALENGNVVQVTLVTTRTVLSPP